MEILATRAFVESAAAMARSIEGDVRSLLEDPPVVGLPCARHVGGRAVVGLTVEPDRAELWFLERDGGGAVDAPPLADLSRFELLEMGVADSAVSAVQRAVSLAALRELPLAPPALARLEFVFVQKARGLGVQPDDLTRRAIDPRHLDDLLHGRITELLLNLDESQRHIVEMGGAGPIVVKGVAGSGKTAVALHRVYGLLGQGSLLQPPCCLYLTYNRALASATVQLLRGMGLAPDDVKIATFHSWCVRFVNTRLGILDSEKSSQLLLEARDATRRRHGSSPVWEYPDQFWIEEAHRIRGRVVEGLPEYRAMKRYGAGRGLRAELREVVWRVVSEYEGLLARRRQLDWDGVAQLAWSKLRALGSDAPRYDHVFIDEAQDLSPLSLRLAAALAGATANVFVAFDPAQSIYERGFRWNACGIPVHGSRSFALTRNHRSTAEILEVARPLLGAMETETDAEGAEDREEPIQPVAGGRRGPTPRDLVIDREALWPTVAAEVRRFIEVEGVPPQNIAVLTYRNWTVERLCSALRGAGILNEKHSKDSELNLQDPSVKVSTMHSAKGLEWPVVVLVIRKDDLAPSADLADPEARASEEATLRRVTYMAMTRAMTALVIMREASSSPPAARAAAVEPPAASARPADDAARVAQGKKTFHRPGCKWLKSGCALRSFATRDEALAQGLRPCTTCQP